MAPHPRILFPFPTNTTECLTSCSSACLFYNLCPPPPLPPPPPSPPSTPIHLRHVIHLPLFLLIPSSFLILLSFLALFICFWRRNRFFNSSSTPVPALIHPGTAVTNEGDQHYVWYIRSVGLDDSAIHAISAWSYKSGDGTSTNTGTNGCAVCLGEFHEGELLRLLPKCGHAFHVPCIDTWLRAHANCPLCRAPVTAPTNSPMPPPPPSPSDDLSDEEGSNTSEGNENGDASSSRTQPVRRSVSMGSMSVDCKDGNFEEGSGSKSKGEKVSLDLERSHSCSCNGFFLSR